MPNRLFMVVYTVDFLNNRLVLVIFAFNNCSPLCIASFVPISIDRIPAKRCGSLIATSCAKITNFAFFTSNGVILLLIPSAPCVSTLILSPRRCAAFSKLFAAKKV